ncbi:MAG: NlpC/P60 family protein, partial [Lachnospiraceae bacterium]|nr:NlpC/P60 family protein [Lachnospiraceae bacterium]
MKRRNQLIGALMAGVMISGSVSAASGLTTLTAAAEDDFGSEDSFMSDDTGDYNEEYSDGGDSFDSGDSGGSDVVPEDTYESTPDSAPAESYYDEGGEGLPDSGETSFPDSSVPEDPSSDPGTSFEMTESEARALDEMEASFNEQAEAEELARLEALEQEESEAEMLTQIEQSDAESAEDELDRAAEEAILEQVRDELQAQADEEAALKKAQEEQEKAANTITSYGYAASNRAYYSGSYFVTSAQKRLALNVGFKKIDKVPAMSAGADAVYIRETQSADGNVVGVLDSKSICYIIDDTLGEWVYVESGEVRGFALKKALKRGKDVETYVNIIGETNMTFAEQKMDPLDNTAYRFSLNTTKDVASILQALGTAAVDRQAMIQFSMQFLGNPYVWGGESLTMGCDCSGFTQQIYAQFGVSIPRTSYQQAEVGVKIPTEEAVPGDLIFYARDGVVYHVLMYIGDNKAINASSSTTGIIISDVDYTKACWACRYISDTGAATALGTQQNTSTQASALQAVGQMAYNGDAAAQEEIINALAQASLKEWRTYGFCRSVIIAQAINESGWLSFGTSAAGIQSTDNNILGMNEELLNSRWTSPWDGKAATRLVPQYVDGENVLGFESMRLYEDMEACMEDYAAFKVGLHPNLIGVTDVDMVIAVGLKGYATNPNYESEIKAIIDRYGLTRFDAEETAAVRPAEDIEGLVVATETSEFSDDTASPVIEPESDASYEPSGTPEVTDDGIEIVYFTDDSADFSAEEGGYESETEPEFTETPAEEREESEVVIEADESAEGADFYEIVYFEDFSAGEDGAEVIEPIPVTSGDTVSEASELVTVTAGGADTGEAVGTGEAV